jgi:FixJ family two-component response regulator
MGLLNEMVYIVDDDLTVCDALSSLLRANGRNVRALSSGAEFLGFERRDAGACLILDLRMPGMDGLEVRSSFRIRHQFKLSSLPDGVTFPPL